MWNLKKGQTELLCRTDADSQTLKNVWSPEETAWGVGGGKEGKKGGREAIEVSNIKVRIKGLGSQ